MIKAIIVEDEIGARSALVKMIKLLNSSVDIIAETDSISDAIHIINREKPQLIFLDIELKDGIGFDMLDELEYSGYKLILTTAYNDYAIKAFKYSAIDYLLKPINPSELKDAVDRAVTSIHTDKKHQEMISVLKSNLLNKEPKLVLKTTEEHHVVNLQKIIYLEADGSYTRFVTTEKNILVSRNIKFYQEILDANFIRCHQSFLVNSKYITSVTTDGFIVLANSAKLPVSVRKKSEVLKILGRT